MSEQQPTVKKVISQKDYLKKYLSGGKKKKEKVKIKKRVQIIDDNIDCVENDIYDNIADKNQVDEFAPQIVGVIDERPQEIKTLDTYKNKNRWKRIGENDNCEDMANIDVNQVNNYVQQINKSTLKDLIKKNSEELIENGMPIKRDRKTGKKRDLKKEIEDKKKEDLLLQEHKKKYAIWGKGVKQVQNAQEKYESDLHEMQKPLARYANDQDLENLLKSKIRVGDPMLEYIKKNKASGNESPDGVQHEIKEFRGFCPPNRFGIKPGHRWDGVDRSNGYEEKWLLQQNSKKSLEAEIYKWSCSDL